VSSEGDVNGGKTGG